MIGHPVGLPLKVADDAVVSDPGDGQTYFEANLDTYGGNSGSAVFNARTGLIEGILVRGAQDFKKGAGDCVVSNVLPGTPGGESVTKINDSLLSFIPKRLQKEMEANEAKEAGPVNAPATGLEGVSDPSLDKYRSPF